MPTPRPSFAVVNVTRPSSIMRDPAELFDGRHFDPGDCIAAMVAAIELVDAARPTWHDEAECKGSPIDFTKRGDTRPALELCGRCDVMTECRSWADELGDVVAVLGGEDVAARRLRWKQTGYVPPTTMSGPI